MPGTYSWTPIIIGHTALALTALVLGAVLLANTKGHRAHRIGGWLWVICMSAVAGVSFAIHGPSGYSWIHILSAFTLISLVCGVLLARAHRVQSHRFTMISIYVGALLIAGAFTLLPGRLIGRALWGWW
jgi:uncharacterized membrane protein